MSSDAVRVIYSRLMNGTRLRQWQLVVNVFDLGNLRLAAEVTGMSQPAATHALAELERLLGLPLFERHARGTRATALGKAVLPQVRAALDAVYGCAEATAALQSGMTDIVRVGAIGAAVSGPLCGLLPAFGDAFPQIVIKVDQQAPETLIAGLMQGDFDLVLCRRDRPFPVNTRFIPIANDHYVVICASSDELADRSGLTADDLRDRLWIDPPPSTIAARDFAGLWAGGPPPQRLCRADAQVPMMIHSIVDKRQALAFAPYNLVHQLIDLGLTRRLQGQWGPKLPPIGMVVRDGPTDTSSAVAVLMRELVSYCARFCN